MPASEVMSLYRQHKLHSGPGGPVVKKKSQATAIQISMARKEGHHIPEVKGSMQQGGLVPETGEYLVHGGEQVNQARDIAARTRAAERDEWRAAMREPHAPYDILGGPPPTTSAHYAVEGLKGNVAERMRQQGEAAGRSPREYRDVQAAEAARRVKGSFAQGGAVPETGDYRVHQGEELVPSFYAGATGGNFSAPIRDDSGAPPDLGTPTPGMPPALGGTGAGPRKPSNVKLRFGGGGSRDNPELATMQSSVAAPLHRVEGFAHGGTIPRTGIYRLHRGEHVIPKSLAGRYREMKRV